MPQAQAGKNITDPAQLGPDVVGASEIQTDAVLAAEIKDGEVKNAELGADAVDATKIADNAIGQEHLGDDAVGLAEMLAGTHGGIIFYAASGVPTELAIGASGTYLKSNGAAADPSWGALGAKRLSLSDTLQASADTEKSIGSNSAYTIKGEFAAPHTGFYRIKFDLKRTGSNITSYGWIYRNNVAYGTEQSETSTTYVTYSEDLFFNAGDLIAVMHRAYNYGGETGQMRNARIYYTENTLLDTCEVLQDNS